MLNLNLPLYFVICATMRLKKFYRKLMLITTIAKSEFISIFLFICATIRLRFFPRKFMLFTIINKSEFVSIYCYMCYYEIKIKRALHKTTYFYSINWFFFHYCTCTWSFSYCTLHWLHSHYFFLLLFTNQKYCTQQNSTFWILLK